MLRRLVIEPQGEGLQVRVKRWEEEEADEFEDEGACVFVCANVHAIVAKRKV